MGYSMPGDQEIYNMDEVIQQFDYKRIGVSGAVFDVQKLDWINQQYLIKNIPQEKLWARLKAWSFDDESMQKLMPLIHSRIKTFGDFMDLCDFFFINHLRYTQEMFAFKDLAPEQCCLILQAIIWDMDENDNWGSSGINHASRRVAEVFGVNHKKVIMPLLFASLMGKTQGPPLFDSAGILGKDRLRARLLRSIEFLGGISNKKAEALKKAWEKKHCHELMTLPAKHDKEV
jgi:glutamyl-tRNA synthetase